MCNSHLRPFNAGGITQLQDFRRMSLLLILGSPTWVMIIKTSQDTSSCYRSQIGGERLPINHQLEIWSLFHSIRLIVKLVNGFFQITVHTMHTMRTGDVCICLRNLHHSCIWIQMCLESMKYVMINKGSVHWSHFAYLTHLHHSRRFLLRPESVRSINKELQS